MLLDNCNFHLQVGIFSSLSLSISFVTQVTKIQEMSAFDANMMFENA